MIKDINTKLIFENFTKEIISDILVDYDKNKIRASGDTEKNLEGTAQQYGTTILAVDYIPFEEVGRGPTTNGGNGDLIVAIKRWVRVKPGFASKITRKKNQTQEQALDSVAWAITKKIHKQGTSLHVNNDFRNLYTQVITEDRIDSLFDELGEVYSKEILSDIIPQLQ